MLQWEEELPHADSDKWYTAKTGLAPPVDSVGVYRYAHHREWDIYFRAASSCVPLDATTRSKTVAFAKAKELVALAASTNGVE